MLQSQALIDMRASCQMYAMYLQNARIKTWSSCIEVGNNLGQITASLKLSTLSS